MPDWLNRQNITFAIAVVGFLLSSASWVKDFLTQRKNIKCEILSINAHISDVRINLMIANHSRAPISVTQIFLVLDGVKYACAPLPVLVRERVTRCVGEVRERIETWSTAMPIQLAGMGAVTALVHFGGIEQLPPDDAKSLTVLICTNRGSPVQMTLQLPPSPNRPDRNNFS